MCLFLIIPFSCFSTDWKENYQDCFVHISIPKNTISCDELLQVQVEVEFPEEMMFDVPALVDGIWVSNGGLHLVSDSVETGENGINIRLQFDPWVLGSGSLVFSKLLFKGTSPVEFFSDVFPFEVVAPTSFDPFSELSLSLLKHNEPDFFSLNSTNENTFQRMQEDYYQKKKENFFSSNYFFSWLWLIVLVCIGVFSIAFFYLKILFSNRNKEKKQIINPSEKAREALKRLVQKKLPEKGLVDRYYTELTFICRTYIEEVFHIQATEQTSEEFFIELSENTLFSQGFKNKIRNFLESADLVKFAKYASTLSECKEAFKAAKELVYIDEKDMQ
jgi:hypothetical protein